MEGVQAHHDQQLRLGQDRPCEAQQLPLADRERIAALADGRVQLLRKLLQSLLHLRLLQCVPDLRVRVLLERVDVLRAAPTAVNGTAHIQQGRSGERRTSRMLPVKSVGSWGSMEMALRSWLRPS